MSMNNAMMNVASDLLSLLHESAEDFIGAGARTHDFQLYVYFERYGLERQQYVKELSGLLDRYGAHPQAHPSVAHSVGRLVSQVRTALPHREYAIVDAFLKSEERLAARIEDLIVSAAIDPAAADMARKMRTGIAQDAAELAALSRRLRFA